MSGPRRVQISRRRKWAGENVVRCDRRTHWGNRYKVDATPMSNGDWMVFRCIDGGYAGPAVGFFPTKRKALAAAVALHRKHVGEAPLLRALVRRDLRGKDLACWCGFCPKHAGGRPFNETCADCPPCHCDVLGEVANR